MQNLECSSIEEVRKNIDSIDKQIVALIAQRDNKRLYYLKIVKEF